MIKAKVILAIMLLVSIPGIGHAQYAEHQVQTTKPGGAQSQMRMPGSGGGRGMGGMGGGMQMMPMMQMMQTMHPAIAVDSSSIYVVRGNQVVKLDKGTLEVVATAMLPAPPQADMHPMGGMQGMGRMQGMGGMPGSMGGAGVSGMMERPDMQAMMNSMSTSSVHQFDQMFLQNMMQHHLGAIEMSRLALTKAVHPELRRFAQRVISTQSRQNKQFNIWLGDWYNTSTQPMMMPMDEEMVNDLSNLRGRDFEVRYMQMMIQHHQEGVQMADMAQQRSRHPELRSAASRIIANQTSEIARLNGWLSEWYGVD